MEGRQSNQFLVSNSITSLSGGVEAVQSKLNSGGAGYY